MPRGVYKRKTKLALPTTVAAAVATKQQKVQIVAPSSTAMTEYAWWKKLSPAEQNEVLQAGKSLSDALINYGTSKLKIGEHLARLQSVLEPHNLFGRFLSNFHFSKRTAYRYIAGFNNAKSRLPETVLQRAMARGVNIIGESEIKPLGVYTRAVEKLPPPANASTEQADTWLNQIEQVRKDTRADEALSVSAPHVQDTSTLLKECFRFVALRYRRLPNNSRTRAAFLRSLFGMIMSEAGMNVQQSFMPTTVPEDFKAVRGRPVPKQQQAAGAVA